MSDYVWGGRHFGWRGEFILSRCIRCKEQTGVHYICTIRLDTDSGMFCVSCVEMPKGGETELKVFSLYNDAKQFLDNYANLVSALTFD